VDSLPDVIRLAVRDVEAATQAPVALIANSALAALSLAGQHVADVERDVGLRGPVSLFVVTIAGSGERKSAVDGWFARPLRDFERNRRSELADDDSRNRAAFARWTAEHDGITAALKSAARKGSDTTALGLRLEAHESRHPVPLRLPRGLSRGETWHLFTVAPRDGHRHGD
jgi:putative DNA primase/helicase